MTLVGKITFSLQNIGSKSESVQPSLITEEGEIVRVQYVADNPFMHEYLHRFENKTVSAEGDFYEKYFFITEISEIQTEERSADEKSMDHAGSSEIISEEPLEPVEDSDPDNGESDAVSENADHE